MTQGIIGVLLMINNIFNKRMNVIRKNVSPILGCSAIL